jgi:quinol monooxygenase YgiN
MIIIAGYTRTDADSRDGAVEAFKGMAERARGYEGCLDFAISADAIDPERVNVFEIWRDQAALNAWRKVAKGPRVKPREAAVSLYRTENAESPF